MLPRRTSLRHQCECDCWERPSPGLGTHGSERKRGKGQKDWNGGIQLVSLSGTINTIDWPFLFLWFIVDNKNTLYTYSFSEEKNVTGWQNASEDSADKKSLKMLWPFCPTNPQWNANWLIFRKLPELNYCRIWNIQYFEILQDEKKASPAICKIGITCQS